MDYLILRLLCGLLTGVILSQTGSLIQMSTRNILASPSTLGLDGLSVLWILLFQAFMVLIDKDFSNLYVFMLGIPVFVIISYLYSSGMIYFRSIEKIILLGITFNLFVGAIFSLMQFLFLAFNFPFPNELWFGHFRHVEASALLILGLLEIFFLVGWFSFKKDLNLFSLGKTLSRNLNLNEKKIFAFIFISLSLGTFCIVSLFGAFSFLGLIFPILSRSLWFKKADLGGEFILGAFVNGGLLMAIDFLCYQFPFHGAEIPVGLLATTLGAVSLVVLLWRSNPVAKKS